MRNEAVWDRICADFDRARTGAGGAGRRAALRTLSRPGFACALLRRMQEALAPVPIVGRPLRRLVWLFSSYLFGSDIAIDAEIGGGIYLPHPHGVVIGACRIGRNVTIMQNVTLGARRSGERAAPVIGDGVEIGAGAVILGSVIVGEGAMIGANAVVLTDIPARATAVGNPARILPPRGG
ncbi:serine acetyltransferase [Rhizobium sp. FKL33]|uniref:serine O-acetyltransferase n=1 Tax=Rhizobium sp. FKL33 TaxID=2562307 RepID=UPI0010C0C486|nr:serine acetyltransferase [Rhizobium sp. FKL33]